ncbi:MAG TPA: hypothetical protein VMD48_02015 [Solirubrobacteraceae bacterium]|nr:hypothetical protein [Solirubrobacteraceae bacterium]
MTNSNATLERRYRRLMRLYPRSYRDEHGEDMVGVLMNGAGSGKRRPGFIETLDLLHNALTIHARYWWQMRAATERNSLTVRNARLVIRIRLAVVAWLTFVTVMLCIAGYWWIALIVVFFIALHLLFVRRAAMHQWPPSGGTATRA